MQKSTAPVESNASHTHGGYKPWPVLGHDAGLQKKPGIFSLSARFNPRLVGFGIVEPAADISDRAEDHPSLQAGHPPCNAEPEEKK